MPSKLKKYNFLKFFLILLSYKKNDIVFKKVVNEKNTKIILKIMIQLFQKIVIYRGI